MYLYQTFSDLYETFPDVPIFPIFENHEPHPLNGFARLSVIAPELSANWLYEEMAELWGKWLPEDTKDTILQRGETDTITAQLQWLADTLYEAEQNSEFVHILTHISACDGTAYIPYST
ncbi:hypothetical protein QE152_g6812 [Popillia japonica]|uniref:Uncharacterized protein n=1 Tax=Popillia japonica TaxID=7064 RepID=A0AAW1MHW4_POPJA